LDVIRRTSKLIERITYERVKEETRIKDKGYRMTCIGRQRGEKDVYLQPIRSLDTRRDVPASLPPGRTPIPLCRRLGGARAGLDRHRKSRVHRISKPVPSTP
jgi:hypothetical protein